MTFRDDVEFFMLIEDMKKIERMVKVSGTDRKENDAEHTWHAATIAMFMDKYATKELDTNKVLRMLLIHDLIEIFAGDTFAFDTKLNEDKFDRELRAMEKLKSYLKDDRANFLESLWLEFEKKETYEAKFANAMDRLQPILLNIHSETGGSWAENKVKLSQILKRAEVIKELEVSVYDFVENGIYEAVEKGFLIDDIN